MLKGPGQNSRHQKVFVAYQTQNFNVVPEMKNLFTKKVTRKLIVLKKILFFFFIHGRTITTAAMFFPFS